MYVNLKMEYYIADISGSCEMIWRKTKANLKQPDQQKQKWYITDIHRIRYR